MMKTVTLLLALVCADGFVVQYSTSNKLLALAPLDAHKIGESWGHIAATAAISAMLLTSPLPALADGRYIRMIAFIHNIRKLSRPILSCYATDVRFYKRFSTPSD